MSMFDELNVEKELLLPEELKGLNIDWKTHNFQTKDLENCMVKYVIKEDGRLFEHVIERDYIPWTEEEKKTKKLSPWDFWKEVIEKGERFEEVNHHGTIVFYTYENFDDKQDFWLEYKAYFVYGKLDKIELVEFKIEQSLALRNEEIREKREQQQSKPWNAFKRYASYLGWCWFWRKVSTMCYKMHRVFSSMQMFILRNML
jgi:hypothetical protein